VAVKGSGVYFTSNLNEDQPSFSLMSGGVGRPTVNLGGVATGASETPNGNFGKIALATPALTNSPLANNYYQRWLYVAEANPDGTFRGLYMTKDRGLNWTKVKLTQSSGATIGNFNAFGFSDVPTAILPEFDPTMFDTSNPLQNPYGRGWAGGNFSLSLAVDPNDPNIVYLGSDALMKIDTTFVNDPYNLSLYNHSNEDGGQVRYNTTGGATRIGPPTITPGIAGGLDALDFSFNPPLASTTPGTANYQSELDAGARRKKWNQINLDRDPYNPFGSNTSLHTTNTRQFNNTGNDVRWVIPGGSLAESDFDYDWVSQVLTIQDPITGEARIIFGHDEGITTYVSQASGTPEQLNGIVQDYQTQGDPSLRQDLQISAHRNGNLQVARLYSGDTQPTMLATDIANALTYAAARRRLDIQRSQKDPLGTGDDNWKSDGLGSTISARANYVQVAQNFNTTTKTVDKTVYILRRINDMSPLPSDPAGSRKTDFFQVSINGSVPFSRTNGLFQNDTTDPNGFGQWDNTVRVFAVNPIDQDAVIMGSAVGRLFRTVDQGRNWTPRGEPGTFDGSYLTSVAFGAPRQAPGVGLSDFFYAGSTNGNIFVTFTGGGNLANSWFKLAGPGANGTLDGSAIMKIVPNPIRGSRELFAVTKNGVFHGTYDIVFDNNNLPTGVANLVWEDVTTNLKTITAAAFNNPNWVVPVLATKDPLLTLAVDWRPTYGQTESHPILYAGGDSGVFRAIYNADQTAWARYTGPANGSSSDGGGLPLVKVTDLDLALGMIDPNTGKVSPAGSPDALIATTLGRGMWSIGLDVPEGFSGPKVIDATPNTPQFQPISEVRVNFDMYITPSSFTRDDVTITKPDGTTVDKSLITVREDLSTPPAGQQDFHTDWFIDFPTFTDDGTYTIKIGPDVRSGNAPMNQDGVLPNGQASDAFVMKVVIGLNDLADYVNDTYRKLLGRSPSTTEYGGTNVVNMDKARLAALGVIVKELLSTYNSGEARQRLVERLFKNGGAAGEIGNLLPGYTLPQAERDFYVNALKNGTRSPESIVIDIIATTDATKGFNQQYFAVKSNGTPLTFLNNVYGDLYKASGVQFGWLPVTTRNNQLTQANTPSGRLTLVRSLVNGAVVKYYPNGDTNQPLASTDFRSEEVKLAYQQILNRAPTAAEVTAGKSLIAKPLAINSIQGSEWLYWKLLSSQEYFSQQVQNETPALPDNGLHTDRSWVEGVIAERYFRTQVGGQYSTDAERDTFSQKVLDRFKLQRAAFVNAIVLGTEYRSLKITDYFQMVHGRNPTDTERAAAQTTLKNGGAFPGLIAGRFASAEFYSTNAPVFVGAQPSTDTWARALVIRLFGVADPGSNDPRVVGLKTRAGVNSTVTSRTTAASWLLNSNSYRDKLIGDVFDLLLGRAPTANELLAYENFLKTHRWEALITDILANGAANATVTAGLPRAFWEEAN